MRELQLAEQAAGLDHSVGEHDHRPGLLRRLAANRPALAALIALALLVVLTFGSQFSNVAARYDPYDDQDYQHVQASPSGDHFFGTDQLGRDTWSRVITGLRISLQIGLGSQILVLLLGLTIGAAAAIGGRFTDNLLMRLTDVVYAFPDLLFVILMRSVLAGRDWPLLGDARLQIMLAIAVVNWTTVARLVRGQMLALRDADYVVAAEALGASRSRLVLRHMLPNTLGPLIVAFTFGIPFAIFAEATLSFLGFGLPLAEVSLGRLVADGYAYMQINPWLVVFPAGAVALLMLCFTLIGDALRDALDPRHKA